MLFDTSLMVTDQYVMEALAGGGMRELSHGSMPPPMHQETYCTDDEREEEEEEVEASELATFYLDDSKLPPPLRIAFILGLAMGGIVNNFKMDLFNQFPFTMATITMKPTRKTPCFELNHPKQTKDLKNKKIENLFHLLKLRIQEKLEKYNFY